MNTLDSRFRAALAGRIGGAKFDAPGGGYSFSSVLAEERKLKEANIPGDPGSALCTLSIADPTWRMPFGGVTAAEAYYQSSPHSTRYTDNNGIPGTHEGIANYLNTTHPTSGVTFTPDWVQYSPGSIKRLLAEYVPAVLFDQETHLIFPDPGYGVIKSPINNQGATVSNLALRSENGKWIIDYPTDLNKDKKNVMYLNVPHNPTGTSYTREEWATAIAWAVENNVILIVDEAYTHLRFDSSASVLDVPGWEQCCVVLQSVSKGWNATGLRFGWVIAHPTLIAAFRKVMDVKDSGLYGPSIASGLWCLKNHDLTDLVRNRYRSLHLTLLQGLQSAGFQASMPGAGLCQFIPAPTSANGVVFGSAVECAQWFRKELRISLMHYEVNKATWLRWAVTITPVPECGLEDEAAVISEVVKRLKSVKFGF